jgi:hypothetical protein
MAKIKKGKKIASIFLAFFILAIVFSVLRSFCLSLFWPLYCLCFDLLLLIISFGIFDKLGQNKERQKDRSTDNGMAKIKKGKRIEAQTIQWPK